MMRELAPSRKAFAISDEEEFTRVYRAGLEEIGLEAIMEKLGDQRRGRGLPLVLLCFEPSSSFCHRHDLREWLGGHGVEIEELQPHDLPRRPDSPQPSLFDG